MASESSQQGGELLHKEAQNFLNMLSAIPIDHNHRYVIAPGNYDYVLARLQENRTMFWYITNKLRYNLYDSSILTIDVPHIWRTESAAGIAMLLESKIRDLETRPAVHRQTRELAKRIGPQVRAMCNINAGTKLCPDYSFGLQDSFIPGLIFEFGKKDSFWGAGGLKQKAETWLKGNNSWLTNVVVTCEIGLEVRLSVFETVRSKDYGGWFAELVVDRDVLQDEEGKTYPGDLLIQLGDLIADGTLKDLPLAKKNQPIRITYKEIMAVIKGVRGQKDPML